MTRSHARAHAKQLKKAAPEPDLLTGSQVDAFVQVSLMELPLQLPPAKWMQVLKAAQWALYNGYEP